MQTSFLTSGLLFDNAYLVRLIFDLPIGANSTKIRRAFDDFLNHPNGAMFRTVFVFDHASGGFLQCVMRPSWKQMEWMTVNVTNEAELEAAIDEYQFGRGSQKFGQGELLTRACMFELDNTPRAVVWSLHHGLGDHWSLNTAEFDIADMYFQRPLPYRRPFKPMIKYLKNIDRTAGLRFWQDHLFGAKPTSFPHSLQNAPRAIVNTVLSREVHCEHSLFSRQFGVMASSLVTAAWSVVLAKHTNDTDVVFGQVVAGRSRCYSSPYRNRAHILSRCSN